jgi:microcystin-dependent protein
MSCSNCYNGCTQIVSDQCVRYTGTDIPVLGIQTGDSLSFVEQALIGFLTSTLDGSGIIITLDPSVYCNVVTKYLPTCGEITAVVLFEALIKATCDLQAQITAINGSITTINNTLTTLEGPYNISNCLQGVTSTSGTHNILQAVISTLCSFITTVEADYALLTEIPVIIQNYLANNVTTGNVSEKMIPYTALPFFGPIAGNFDTTGAGLAATIWEKIYLCNGQNGTPDLRGRTVVGVTTGMGGGAYSSAVNPSLGNPDYLLNVPLGANFVTIDKTQMPLHSHPGSTIIVELSDPGHAHTFTYLDKGNPGNGAESIDLNGPSTFTTQTSKTGITVSKAEVTVAGEGGGLAHPNFQPGIGSYYIMYIP